METLVIPAESAAEKSFDPVNLDKLIYAHIPSGASIRDDEHPYNEKIDLTQIRCPKINGKRAKKSIGTLGGGNHFIEANRDNENDLYIVIHSGSRHLGKEIAEYYQEEAWHQLNKNRKQDIDAYIQELKNEGREHEIQEAVSSLKSRVITGIEQDLAYVSDELFDDYLNDMKITQYFALLNRRAMMEIILHGLGIDGEGLEQFSTIHNYIDTEAMILRKGAVSARSGEKIIIPINMRDGSIICEGLGNPDWNYSAPHGAGRVLSRKKAFAVLTMEEFKKSMEGIYSTSINKSTIDESPMAYKNMDDITANISPTARVLKIIKPVYNYKASQLNHRKRKHS
jgi:RNA-splicing ligase RtcB